MDVVVIGAGVIGVSVADALAQRGANVRVLDMRSPGRGASAASAGVLAPFIEAGAGSDATLLELCERSFAMFDDFVASARERSRRAIEFTRCGTVQVALDPSQADRLQTSRAWLDTRGIECMWHDGDVASRVDPAVAPSVVAALEIPAHAFVRVGDLVQALVLSARQCGAIFESPVEAAAIAPAGTAIEVRAGTRRYHADRVVVAAGSWSGRIAVQGASLPRVVPVRGQLLHLEWRERIRPSRIVWGEGCYVVPWSDDSVLVGATVEDAGFDESTSLDGIRSLMDAAVAVLPGARTAALREVRVGLRPMAPGGLPFIGPLPEMPAVCVASGHYRNGILLAPLTASLVADSILEGVTP
jgi:glycine oxidase